MQGSAPRDCWSDLSLRPGDGNAGSSASLCFVERGVMNRRPALPLLLAAWLVLGSCKSAWANSISPYAFFLPGLSWLSPVYAFPISLLAAFLERPFLSRAGIRHRPLVLSLRANLVSTLAGFLVLPVGLCVIAWLGTVWCVAAVLISCAVEIWFLQRFSGQPFRPRWIVWGNVVSSLVVIALPPVAAALRESYPQLHYLMQPYRESLYWFALVTSLLVFGGSFAWRVQAAGPSASAQGGPVQQTFLADKEPSAPEAVQELPMGLPTTGREGL